jgi:hypothetical protein
MRYPQRVISADASDFLPPSESADEFHDSHDNIHKPSHEEHVKEGACETANEQKCDDSPSSEHGFLAMACAPQLSTCEFETDGLNQLVQALAPIIFPNSNSPPPIQNATDPRNNEAGAICSYLSDTVALSLRHWLFYLCVCIILLIPQALR